MLRVITDLRDFCAQTPSTSINLSHFIFNKLMTPPDEVSKDRNLVAEMHTKASQSKDAYLTQHLSL